MFQLIFTIHIILCMVLVGLVLLQQGKGADAGAIVGGGSDSVFGAGTASSFVSKLTTGLAIAFMVTSILMVKLYQERAFIGTVNEASPLQGSVLEGSEIEKKAEEVKAVTTEAATTTDTKKEEAVQKTETTNPEKTEAAKPAEAAPAAQAQPAPAETKK